MSWVVLPITEEHIAGFCAAVDRVAREREYLAFLEGPPLEMSRAFVLRNLKENRPHFVALADGEVVGWCDISSLERPVFAHSGVLGMGVVAAYRGQGIGAALIRAALGSVRLLLARPVNPNKQVPHSQDEIYVIVQGSGVLFHDGKRDLFGPGDAMFVTAGTEHRFEDFTDDLAVWVVFCGPIGGEVKQ